MGKKWTEQEIELLGENMDSVVAKVIGRTENSIRNMRRKLKIPPFTLQKFNPTPEQIKRLGSATIAHLSREFGVSRTAIFNARQRLGIDTVHVRRVMFYCDQHLYSSLKEMAKRRQVKVGEIAKEYVERGVKNERGQ